MLVLKISVRTSFPFHQEIIKARNPRVGNGGGGGHKSRSNKKTSWKVKTARRKLSKLKREVEALEEKKRNVSAIATNETNVGETSTAIVLHGSETQAGTAFGGKNSKRIKQA